MVALLFGSFVIPTLYSVFAAFIKQRFRALPYWERVGDMGWDLVMIGLGGTAAFFSDPLLRARFGDALAIATATAIVMDLFLMLVVLHFTTKRAGGLAGTMALMFGFCAIAVPSTFLLI